ncbi:ABC transporter substrate-binding protein [Actinomadura viridis]|uniref:Thiamine pyrimidine synthase n=1 Tax=Actinomadura viridis TaxID=58110 RepID=A0A931GS79_9ACTN|nr:ABC transporter substrate-binding protein [Actinomadura viridis]MBG6090529.1 NitT/TauT family transport system substrate-binding protein [Actinomadura viridis]
MSPRRLRAALAGATLLLATACGSSGTGESTGSGPVKGTALIGADRCAQNKKAGPIVYLTSYDLGGGMSVLNAVVADALGYFEDLCLDVTVRPKAENNAQLVSAGTAKIAGLGSAGDALTATANGAAVVGIATYGNVGQIELMTVDDGKIKTLKDLEGKTLGYKVAMPGQLTSMLRNAGVDVAKVKKVSVGFDPTILPQGKVDALQGYKDNEPGLLRSRGYKIKEWSPTDFGVKGTFGTQIANRAWAGKNPTAVEDFLRATLKAFSWLNESKANLDQGIAWSQQRSQAGYDVENETRRWRTGSEIVLGDLIDGHGVAHQTPAQWQPEADALLANGTIKKPVDVAEAQDNRYIEAIHQGSELVWPAPGGTAPAATAPAGTATPAASPAK